MTISFLLVSLGQLAVGIIGLLMRPKNSKHSFERIAFAVIQI